MPSQATSSRVTVAVLAALLVSVSRCGESEPPGPGCDYGKVSLDMDLSAIGAVDWDCASSTWPESAQRLPSVDTVYDPEPARQICMDKPISYHHTIPNSGAYRPVRAESGEYLYCPPQRWLNNLHHGATVLLYHPCAPLIERHRLSVLARSCLPDYIITPHLQLNKHMPLALVSWGRTLELSTVASADICDWLETAQTRKDKSDGVSESREYNLLLTWSAGQEQPRKMKESLRQCCEQIISSLLTGATLADLEPTMKAEHLKEFKEGGKSRQIRAALKNANERHTTTTNVSSQTNRNVSQRTGDVHNYSTTLGPSADSVPEKRIHSNPSNAQEEPQSKSENLNQGPTRRPTAPLCSLTPKTTLRTHSLRTPQSQKGRVTLQRAALQPSPQPTKLRNPDLSAGKDALAHSVKSVHNPTARPEAETLRSKDEGTDSIKHKDKDFDEHSMKVNDSKEKKSDKDYTAEGKMKDNEVVDVKEREVETKDIHRDRHSHRKSENAGFDSVAESQSESQPQPAHDSQYASFDCDSCKAGEQCDCSKASGAEAQAAVVNKGLPKTPRTDEAVWAAAALGFLLVLLTLSVLHTRLYRHWRTTPSLYWHDPRQDYDSVADVIRRRLRIAQRRRKRGRRQECVLLPSSSSSDEHP
uniref:Tumor protein p53 inducible protein 13 n=2 Tax=Acanthochromis polyacanthus TaxID=80966 RepID=A0A3Q1FUY0_9TELE